MVVKKKTEKVETVEAKKPESIEEAQEVLHEFHKTLKEKEELLRTEAKEAKKNLRDFEAKVKTANLNAEKTVDAGLTKLQQSKYSAWIIGVGLAAYGVAAYLLGYYLGHIVHFLGTGQWTG